MFSAINDTVTIRYRYTIPATNISTTRRPLTFRESPNAPIRQAFPENGAIGDFRMDKGYNDRKYENDVMKGLYSF